MILIFCAPSGAGKSTLVNYLLEKEFNLEFSVSATSRAPRGSEENGVAYHFLTPDQFKEKIANNEFVEYEEVYENLFYGTLKSEIERIEKAGRHVVFDVDVVGGLNLKRIFGNRALAIFIAPPSINELHRRLVLRATDSAEMIQKRIAKADLEMTYAPQFDYTVVNDNLAHAKQQVERLVADFLK